MVAKKNMSIRSILLIAILALSSYSFGQEKTRPTYKAALSFSPGFLTENTITSQIHGYFGLRPMAGNIELRGDGFYFMGSQGDRPRFTMNHQVYAGAFYRFSNMSLQPYAGFQPGIAYSQSSEYGVPDESGNLVYKKTVNPVGSIAAGVDFFGEKVFFLFAETRYIFGKHTSDSYPIFLDEWRLSFGLGFHF